MFIKNFLLKYRLAYRVLTLFTLAFLIIFLLLAYLPSFFDNTAFINFDKDSNAFAIYSNNKYLGTTHNNFYLEKGDYNLKLFAFDKQVSSIDLKVRPRRFFSILSKSQINVNFNLDISEIRDDLINYMRDITYDQSLIKVKSKDRVYNRIIEDTTLSFLKAKQDLSSLIKALKDMRILVSNEDIQSDINKAFSLLNRSENFSIVKENTFKSTMDKNNLIFIRKADFRKFLLANPSFNKSVIDKEIADDLYLATYEDLYDDDIISSISYNVASAYSEYLSKLLNEKYKVADIKTLSENLVDSNINIASNSNYYPAMYDIELDVDNAAKAVINYKKDKVGLLRRNECSLTTTYVLVRDEDTSKK